LDWLQLPPLGVPPAKAQLENVKPAGSGSVITMPLAVPLP
jgi:hypothetical protein